MKRMILVTAIFTAVSGCRTPDTVAPVPVPAGESAMSQWTYPEPPRSEVVDVYHGVRVEDPYRVLEDHEDPRTVEWTERQNALTERALDRPIRPQIADRLRELFDYARVSTPIRRGERLFFSRNDGLQNQPLWYVQEGEDGEPRLLIDPNKLSEDGTVALAEFSPSPNGEYVAYTISRSGSDWREISVIEVDSGRTLDDHIEWVKFTDPAWTPDNRGFFYNRYPQPGTVPAGDEHYFAKVMYHPLGSDPASDRLVYNRPEEKATNFSTKASRDGRWTIITANQGSSDNAEILIDDVTDSHGFREIISGFQNAWSPIDVVDGKLYLITNRDAPMRKIVAFDIAAGTFRDVVPEADDYLNGAELAGDHLVLHYLRNASSALELRALDGRLEREIELPGLVSIQDMETSSSQPVFHLSFHGYVQPPVIWRIDASTGAQSEFWAADAPFDPSQYETVQVWYTSKDGTRVPMFISRRKGLPKSPATPALLYGYGGFNNALTPGFNPVHFWLIEQGGIYAVASLRGGSEFGEAWHQAGMLGNRQNVYDDFYAAAEYLTREGFTSKEKLAISGRSNGGLLAAVALTQRPDLFEAAVVQVPVIDMLRYHLFTVARFWIPEYGSSEDPGQFRFLYAYSPLHNVVEGREYPATLITTAETDDRVDPGQAKKFAATLQQAQGGNEPILIRIESKAGHSSGSLGVGGKPVSKLIEEWADIWTFVMWQLGKG